uniref:Si:ch211-194b1.1 n=1 Tax=Sinocyclocheilus anshuiensis TaxID=1608454 RepID=A0A671R3G8_9TELE
TTLGTSSPQKRSMLVLMLFSPLPPLVANFDPSTFSVMRCEFCSAGFDTRAGLSSHARAHLRDFGITNWEVTVSPINILRELFAKYPDLVLPTATTHTIQSGQEQNSDEEQESRKDIKDEENMTAQPATLYLSRKRADVARNVSRTDQMTEQKRPQQERPESPFLCFPGSNLLKCEFCGATFETRRGLSSHARSHLRQLGIGMSENSGAPIDLLYQITKERSIDAHFTGTSSTVESPKKPQHHAPIVPIPSPTKDVETGEGLLDTKPTVPFSIASSAIKVSSSPTTHSVAGSLPSSPFVKSRSPSPVLRKAPISSLLPVSSPLRSQEHKTIGKNQPTNHSSPSKPFWAPQETDAPLNLSKKAFNEPSRDIRCEFCGEFFENRKGLSSHARSHLRHMGITEWSVNGSPIDTLWEVMRRQGSTPASVALGIKEEPGQDGGISLNSTGYQSSALSRKSPLNLLHSGSRLHKHGLGSIALSSTSPMGKIFGVPPLKKKVMLEEGQPGEKLLIQSKNLLPPPQDYSVKGKASMEKHASCELCGFYFENRKALASHARAHLRQFGVTEWCVNGSPIETLSAWIRSRPQKAAEMQQGKMTVIFCRGAVPLSHCPVTLNLQLLMALFHSLAVIVPIMPFHMRRWLIVNSTCVCHERRPLKHPSHAEGGEGESGPPKPRSSTVPALVPKPPSTPLVRLVGKIYSLKCRFCDMEFHGPLSVQEDWIRHLQQHILNLNYNKTASPANDTPAQSDTPDPKPLVLAATSTSTTTTAPATTPSTPSPKPTTMPTSASTPTPAPNQASAAIAEPIPSPAK